MGDVINIEDAKRIRWDIVTWTCPVCGHKVTSIYPRGGRELECGGCRAMIGIPLLEDLFPWIKEEQ